ncbi:hypothetical protein MUG78_10950 [Gordonia alkaliphila]|uniref:hypothetical protein n=1 Tax=Gordonia alkaliphila TaxID=1053547 RepID=UPI001FF575F0|nr:hypothetical protein [Gordonia alkaliphila]MCK0439960.1 hypothetical protein [Gordonia alkaliphila]
MINNRPWTALREASKETFGIVSTEQSARYGIAVEQLEAAAARGEVWKTPDELWIVEDVDIFRIEDWAAAWLAIDLDTPISLRRANPESFVSHQSAAMILSIGDVTTRDFMLTVAQPLPWVPAIVRQMVGALGRQGVDWELVDGLPVATPARIVADLAAARSVDGSHLGTVLYDILAEQLLTADELAEIMRPYLHFWSHQPELGPHYVMDLLIASFRG